MRIAISGSRGRLGTELVSRLGRAHQVVPLDRPAYDLRAPGLARAVAALELDWLIHTAAMTDVDGCARDPELAHEVNGEGTRRLAQGCQEAGTRLCYISTNEVFPGNRAEPYDEEDEPLPINPYGRSKLAGERYAQEICPTSLVVRTAWLYGRAGRRDFVRRILQAAELGDPLRVVTDEISSPTYAPELAEGVVGLVEGDASPGVYHLVNEGGCSRFEFTRAILEAAGRGSTPVEPITSDQWARLSTPPHQSQLRNRRAAALGIRLGPWREALLAYIQVAVLP